MKELKVGERIVLEVKENVFKDSNFPCMECFFFNLPMMGACYSMCEERLRSDGKSVIFKEVKKQKRKMKENKHSLKISRSCGDITLDGYPVATYSNDELKILKNLITKVLGEVNEYIKE